MEPNGNNNPTQQPVQNEIRLLLRFDPTTGSINVEGPIANGILCYGMLEMARQAIERHIMALAANNRIVPASVLPMIRH